MMHGGAADSLSYQSAPAEQGSAKGDSRIMDFKWQYDGIGSFSTASDRLAAPVQDSRVFTSARVAENKAVEKLLANDSCMRIGMPAMGFALLTLAAMLGIRMRRRLRQATTFVDSGEHESDMSITLAARINSPVSVFDPLGVFANSERPSADPVKHYREAELTHGCVAVMHGRVAMFAGSSAPGRTTLAFSSQRQLTRLNALD